MKLFILHVVATAWVIVILPLIAAGAPLQCFDCHGNRGNRDIRPIDAAFRNPSGGGFQGNHRTHLGASATQFTCAKCHPGSDSYTSSHRNGLIAVSSRINNSPVITPYGGITSAFSQTSVPNPGSCGGVNCHFEKNSPDWGSPPLDKNSPASSCNVCHGAAPSDGAHPSLLPGLGKKHGQYLGTSTSSCVKCHPDHLVEPDPFVHATSAGSRSLVISFTSSPNSGGTYSGDVSYPKYLPSQSPARNGACNGVYCHSDGRNGPPTVTVNWTDGPSTNCYSCHKGRPFDNTTTSCVNVGGTWGVIKNPLTGVLDLGICRPFLTMSSNGHHILVGAQWIRKYPCYYCHNNTVDAAGNVKDLAKHVDGVPDVAMAPKWNIVGRPAASYDPVQKTCNNVYCHSDGTDEPDVIKPVPWNTKTACNSCHGHPIGECTDCHDGVKRYVISNVTTILSLQSNWAVGQEWKAALPMFPNKGPGTARANSHPRHVQTDFTCDICHYATIRTGGDCTSTNCHVSGIPAGSMGEASHIDPAYHVDNKQRDVTFKASAAGVNASYDYLTKTCTNIKCHAGASTPPVWGGAVNSAIICMACHGSSSSDVDSFSFKNFSTQARINLQEWYSTGHGRKSSKGPYKSGNPAANFPGNPCWYCHDNNIIHNDPTNPFRLRMFTQFANRFEKECVYCHMIGEDSECLGCHNNSESLAPQLSSLPADPNAKWPDGTPAPRLDHAGYLTCTSTDCHYIDPAHPTKDLKVHNEGAGYWDSAQKADVKNQYMMMGVCLKCHDDDSNNKCTFCHTAPANNPGKYSLGYDPGTGFIKPAKARASSVHFGYKHNRGFINSGGWNKDANGKHLGTWKGGKFCWDCHDPHGDTNIYMVQNKVATSTDGIFGIPRERKDVVFTKTQTGLDYARISYPYNGICNVCHSSASKHYRSDYSDSHQKNTPCTKCHEHRFTDSHADDQSCNACHKNKPVPRHSGFGLPRDCTKCHDGTINKRMDIMNQFVRGKSHHIQGIETKNKHCYACHWESDSHGMIDNKYHEGYSFKTYSTIKNAKVDLVVWKPELRPTYYNSTTAVIFLASDISAGGAGERAAAAKVTIHCISCHSEPNNDIQPFEDCRTPRQYAWDKKSIAARYSQSGSTPWGKYGTNGKNVITKSFSAHGNAVANQGGWNSSKGTDEAIPNTRAGTANVECYDCHSSHGSNLSGITSSYVTFNGTKNGGNLKETQAGKGGYKIDYMASSNSSAGTINPYSAGAGQCFDCHNSSAAVTTPWGYQSTFGATQPIKGYFDSPSFGQSEIVGSLTTGVLGRYPYKKMGLAAGAMGGHLKASSPLHAQYSASMRQNKINGLCTPCHDPHGVSPSLGAKQAYGVPLLKGTWMTSPYKEDVAAENGSRGEYGGTTPTPFVYTDQSTFGGSTRINENDDKFAGLCMRCHAKGTLTAGSNKAKPWKGIDRIHQSVKGWGVNDQHSYTCSKCHAPHSSNMPRLMITNCLDYKHQGRSNNGGSISTIKGDGSGELAGSNRKASQSGSGGFPGGENQIGVQCHHEAGAWPDNSWNWKTPW